MKHMQEVKLGFGIAPRPEYVYCNRSQGCLWYFFRDEKVCPIEEKALTGYVTGVEAVSVERRGKDSGKLRIRVQADRQYILEAGAQTTFAKGFLGAWGVMSKAQKSGVVTIEVSPADREEKALFCSVYDSFGTLIVSGKVGQVDAAPVISPLAARVKSIVKMTKLNMAGKDAVKLKKICQDAGLPESSASFIDADQVLMLRSILFQLWADDRNKDTVQLMGLLGELDGADDAQAWDAWRGAVEKAPAVESELLAAG